eukprot:TRINITY_DN479_c3_g1_i3.p1 TRINITY_DN479_c3_g1~~TRINITY_DN479_c3_g1_i3.p1  ORF type:complete len:752 (-),score=200.06 TRINITY_DN479_c3_g1_i3:413-2668(-)
MAHDALMNFLTRRQVVIFADDSYFSYTAQNSLGRTLGNNASLHVLRCPRSVCPAPAPYRGAASRFEFAPSVKVMNECRIVEMKFVNEHNVALKAAWYEALGRVLGAPDGWSAGKMMTRMDEAEVVLSDVREEWVGAEAQRRFEAFGEVEVWRAQEILQWIEAFGMDRFSGLGVMGGIDWGELRLAMRRARLQHSALRFVPRRKRRMLVFGVGGVTCDVLLAETLTEMGLQMLQHARSNESSTHWYRVVKKHLEGMEQSGEADGMQWRRTFVSLTAMAERHQLQLLRYAAANLAHVRVLLILGDWHGARRDSLLSQTSRALGEAAGSHVHVIDVPLQALGSFAALRWLYKRLNCNRCASVTLSDLQLLRLAERNHARFERCRASSSSPPPPLLQLLPVARLLFSLNVGRSGSRYLADVLRTADAPIVSEHEAACAHAQCSGGGAMRMQQLRLNESYQLRSAIKTPMIRHSVASAYARHATRGWRSERMQCARMRRGAFNAAQQHARDLQQSRAIWEVSSSDGCVAHQLSDVLFSESNANFKAWMFDVVLEQFPRRGYHVTLLVVRRNVAAVVRSLYRTGYFSTRDGYNWMETAAGVNSRLKLSELSDDSKLDAVEKLLSYVLNAEALFREVLRRYVPREGDGARAAARRVSALQLRAERMFEREGTRWLMQQLRLRWSAATAEVAGSVRDKYAQQEGEEEEERRRRRGGGAERTQLLHNMTLRECERRIERLQSKLSRRSQRVVRELLSAWQ